ncbi:peptidase inhibitor family I36 protein [Streptomyces albidochromogenes]|uniref:peptidase inhibitor family I36 protein n=1 Tax=Streptomyces albidochromogenes TaxID=329524 RepID=UPI001FCA8043|nr:peptidase inhibitor family I36 protein [Streptomyces albidochromogenes]
MAAPAQAFGCTYNNVCLWSDSGHNGYVRNDFNSRTNWSQISYDGGAFKPLYQGDGVIDNVSSIDNWDPDTRVSVYYNSGYFGPCFKVEANGAVSNMASIYITSSKTANDNMNSHKFSNECLGATYNF